MRYHYTHFTMVKIQNTDAKWWFQHGATRTLIHCWWERKMVQPLGKIVWQVSYKAKHTLTIRCSNCAPWYLPKWLKTFVHTKTCIWMFTAALFVIAKTWKQSRCPSISEWIDKLWYILTMDYSATKRNELSSHKKTWKNLKNILLSERSQSEKATHCMSLTMWHSGKGKTTVSGN